MSDQRSSEAHETDRFTDRYDAVVVGAGPAGVAVGAALAELDVEFLVVDREGVGAALRAWPAETRLLTPSFASNSFGQVDLNAVAPRTAPAFSLGREHPTGEAYADYLEGVVDLYDVPVESGVEVTGLDRVGDGVLRAAEAETGLAGTDGDSVDDSVNSAVAVDGGTTATTGTAAGPADAGPFRLDTSAGPLVADHVVWAAGEFGNPRRQAFTGAERGVHYADVESWAGFAVEHGLTDHEEADEALDGGTTETEDADDRAVVIGGFESGVDAAVGLVNAGATVTLVDSGDPWSVTHPDPSEALSPYSRERLDDALETGRLTLESDAEVVGIDVVTGERGERAETDEYVVRTVGSETFRTPAPPVVATGFEPNLGPAAALFADGDRGFPALSERDESTRTPGLFLAGPAVTHEGIRFCFVYKFRQRAPVVAAEIADRCGAETAPLNPWREEEMFLEDLSCCEPDVCDC